MLIIYRLVSLSTAPFDCGVLYLFWFPPKVSIEVETGHYYASFFKIKQRLLFGAFLDQHRYDRVQKHVDALVNEFFNNPEKVKGQRGALVWITKQNHLGAQTTVLPSGGTYSKLTVKTQMSIRYYKKR